MAIKRLLGIEISDLGITAARMGNRGAELIPLDGESVELSSFAQLNGKGEVVFGQKAFQQFLTPEVPVDNQFWYRLATLDDAPEIKNSPRFQPADADLAQAHLSAVFAKCIQASGNFDEVALVVPGHFKSSRLAALIQITRETGIPVHHVLDSSLAALLALASAPAAESLLVVDLYWNTADVALVRQNAKGLERVDVLTDRGLGLRPILDRLIDGLGKRFIDECRFDPASRPDYAQQLYNALFPFLADFENRSSCKLEVAKGSITVDKAGLSRIIDTELQNLRNLVIRGVKLAGSSEKAAVFLTSRVRLLPGIADLLGNKLSISPVLLETGQSARGALAFLNAWEEGVPDQPLFHSQVEFSAESQSPEFEDQNQAEAGNAFVSGPSGVLRGTTATHLLFQGRLLPLPEFGDPDFVIGSARSISSGLTVVEPVPGLAERHLRLRRSKTGNLEAMNLGQNNTWHNGKAVGTDATVTMQTGDVLVLGDAVLQFMITGMVLTDA